MLKNHPLWETDCAPFKARPLDGDRTADAVVIGGGMAGVLTAYRLQARGLKVLLIERDRIGAGVTGRSTAKITAQHTLIYHRLLSRFGLRYAKLYAQSNLRAIEDYAQIVRALEIDCGFARKTAYVYSTTDRDAIRREMNAARVCGIDAFYREHSDELPFPVRALCGFQNQAQFDPLRFLHAVARTLTVFDKTTALDVKPGKVLTDRGVITADHIVVCTHYPFYNGAGLYFARLHQQTSYVVALHSQTQPEGMYICADNTGYSLRAAGDFILLGGAAHRTGLHKFPCYRKLFHAAKLYYPQAKPAYFWSAQDCISVDRLPYIGRYSPKFPRLYVATGFQKWGMTLSMVSANLLADLIVSGRSALSELYEPTRLHLAASVGGFQSNLAVTSKSLIRSFLLPSGRTLDDLPRGTGGVIRDRNRKIGVYRDHDDRLYAVSARCPHMGCELRFNNEDKTWDCPCHGSRFDIHGRLLNNPANGDLAEKALGEPEKNNGG